MSIFLSYFPSYKIFTAKKISTPIIKGSVGTEIPNPISILLILMDNGVRKVMNRTILSSETKYKRRINNATGTSAPHI